MMTLSKLAKLANVSVSTASKAFSGSSEVNEETREMIFEIARKNGCFKKFYNVKYPKLVIAIIAPEFDSAYYTRYLSYIQKFLHEKNCELCVSTTDFSIETEQNLLEYYCKHANVDGIIAIQSRSLVKENYEVPISFIIPSQKQSSGSSIFFEIEKALQKSIDYLVEKKVDSIGFIGETLTKQKQERFQKALEKSGIAYDEELVSISDERFEEGGYAAMEALFARKKAPRAIVCAYDYMAIGAIRCIYDHGFSVPEDIAILGFDDISQAKFLNPSLASIAAPVEQLCKLATDAVLQQINGKSAEQQQTLEAKFHLRKSFEIS